MPFLPLPKVKQFDGPTGDDEPCIICGRPMKDKAPKFLHIVDRDGLQVVPPDVEYKDSGTDMYYHPVGAGCLKKYPELRLYAVKQAGDDKYEPVSRTCKCGERPYSDRLFGVPGRVGEMYWVACNCGRQTDQFLNLNDAITAWNRGRITGGQ